MRTRQKILEIITERGPVRPDGLLKELGLSGTAIHRQLRRLVEDGAIERRGSPPFTRYGLAGVPDFASASTWLTAERAKDNPSSVCETRDVLAALLPRLKDFLPEGLSPNDLPLVIAAVGEVANNSFDHNLGLWRDMPGCWLESQTSGGRLWTLVADRGQGVLRSLVNVVSGLADDQAALYVAFSQQITGRAPERRGNGLKFVRAIVEAVAGRGIACGSGNGLISFGDLGPAAEATLRKNVSNVNGTVTVLVWELA